MEIPFIKLLIVPPLWVQVREKQTISDSDFLNKIKPLESTLLPDVTIEFPTVLSAVYGLVSRLNISFKSVLMLPPLELL